MRFVGKDTKLIFTFTENKFALKQSEAQNSGRPLLDKIMGDLLQTGRVHISWSTSSKLGCLSENPLYNPWYHDLLRFKVVSQCL